jgi:hypothetical protein
VIDSTSLGANTENRIAYNVRSNQIFVTYEDSYQGRQFSPLAAPRVLRESRHPLQIGAISVSPGDQGRKWYVQNWMSNTITVIPAVFPGTTPILQHWESTIDATKLSAYRDAVILAFTKMLGRFLQYLKDCFCELLLVDCPDEEGKVFLADVSFKDDHVYQICNFHRRRYVHTFRTVEYWFSLIPVIPLLKKAVEIFCCSVLTGFFDNIDAPSKTRSSVVNVSSARSGAQWANAANLGSMFKLGRSQLMLAGAFSRASLTETLARPPAGTAPSAASGVSTVEVLGMPSTMVTENATRKGVTVNEVLVSDSATTTARTLAATALKIGRIPAGTTVNLITDRSGRVVGYQPVETRVKTDATRTTEAREISARMAPAVTAAATADATRADIARLNAELVSLRDELAALRAKVGG